MKSSFKNALLAFVMVSGVTVFAAKPVMSVRFQGVRNWTSEKAGVVCKTGANLGSRLVEGVKPLTKKTSSLATSAMNGVKSVPGIARSAGNSVMSGIHAVPGLVKAIPGATKSVVNYVKVNGKLVPGMVGTALKDKAAYVASSRPAQYLAKLWASNRTHQIKVVGIVGASVLASWYAIKALEKRFASKQPVVQSVAQQLTEKPTVEKPVTESVKQA